MTTLYDSTVRVKSISFGRGLLRSLPTTTLPCTLDDAAWAAQTFGELSDRRDAGLDHEYDLRAADSAAMDRLERGFIAPDLADYIASSRVGGHYA